MLSVIILTKNQSELLKVCLESVKWADEIIVVDDDSTEDIASLAKQYTDKIFVHTLTDFSNQRNFGCDQASGDWLLLIDPDERVTKELRQEITSKISQEPAIYNAFAIPRKNYYLGIEQRKLDAWPDFVIRLLRKEALKEYEGVLHEQPKFSGQLGYLTHPFIHLTHRDIASMTQKTIAWSSYEAQLRLDVNHPKMTSPRFFRIILTTFFDWYVKKGGYKAGVIGTIESIFQTFSVFMTYVRLWEMQQEPTNSEKYQAIDQTLLSNGFSEP